MNITTMRTSQTSFVRVKTTLAKEKMKGLITAICLCMSFAGVVHAGEWKLLWSDEFDYGGLPDTTKWDYEEGFIRNNEKQYYTRECLDNVRVTNGVLVIEGRKEDFKNPKYKEDSSKWQEKQETAHYTSGCIITLGKASFKYGRVEVRAKMPKGKGTWPAFFMFGTNRVPVGWPRCGEIDIVEYIGNAPRKIHGATHFAAPTVTDESRQGKAVYKASKHVKAVKEPYENFHLYAIEWDEKQIKFFYDDEVYGTFNIDEAGMGPDNPFRKPHYLLLNLALGGSFGGKIDDSELPQKYEIDYVRVFNPKIGQEDAGAGTPTTPAPANQTNKSPVILDARSTGSVFEGIGALSAGASSRLLIDYPEPQRSEILDFLFKPKFGAALQHLKVEIGGDVDSTDGTEPSLARTREEFTHPKPEYFNRGYEWWLMKEAKKRNPQIIFDVLQWGAPGWIGNGKFYSQDNADFIVAFIKGAKQYHDLDIGYCGIWNEKAYNTEWIKLLRQTLNTNGLNRVQIVAADEIRRWTIADKMAEDPALRDAIQVIGTHYPRFQSTPVAQGFGKPLWASEDGPWSGVWSAPRGGQCPGVAQAYNRNYITGKMTKTIIWSPITSYYDNLPVPGSGLMLANTPWSGHYDVQPAIWMTAHTTQFIQPGWKYLGGGACALLPLGGSHVAAISPDGKDLSLVVETFGARGKALQHLSFKLADGLSCPKLHLWRSTEKEQFIRLDDVTVSDGTFSLNVEPGAIYSLTTTDGQCKGTATIPASQPFPLPYKDDFEGYASGATPKYLSDFFGAFEIATKSDGGKCLKQLITHRGIAWVGDGDPVTVIGSPDWRDYEVACDVCLGSAQTARICGRIAKMPHGGRKPSTGYGLAVSADGVWQLMAGGKQQLLAGKITVVPGEWLRIGLRFQGDQITVLLEGKEVGTVADSTYKNGLAGLGSGYEMMQFDNLRIESSAPLSGMTPKKAANSNSTPDNQKTPISLETEK